VEFLDSQLREADSVRVFGRIDNLFDVHYQNPIGFERLGFGI
jgi:hypothetical protein